MKMNLEAFDNNNSSINNNNNLEDYENEFFTSDNENI